jgi:hypothetical protein
VRLASVSCISQTKTPFLALRLTRTHDWGFLFLPTMNQYYIKAVISNGDYIEAVVAGHIICADNVNEAIQNFRSLVLVTDDEDNHYYLVQKGIFIDIIEISKVSLLEVV